MPRLPRVLCAIAAAIGAVLVIGHVGSIEALRHAFPGRPSLANTALALALLGLAGVLRTREHLGRRGRVVATAAALLAATLGGLTLLEHLTGHDLGIDELLAEAGDDPAGGRPPVIAALAFVMFGIALLAFDTRRKARARPSEWLLIAAGLIAVLELIAHVFDVPHRYPSSADFIGVRPGGGVGLVLLAIGLLLARRDAGLMRVATSRGPGGVLFRRLVLPIVFAPALIGLLIRVTAGEAAMSEPVLLVATLFAATSVVGVLLLPLFAAPLDRAHTALEEDVIARRAAEEEAKRSQARLESVIGIAADSIISINAEQRITLFNRGAEEAFGWTAAEMMGKPLELLSPERQRAQVRAYVDRFAAESSSSRRPGGRTRAFVGLRKNGGEFPCEAAISKLEADDELMFTIVMRDMTYHAKLESELRKAVAARDEVMGIVAHDLRNPLATAMLTAELLVRPEHERRLQSRLLADRLTRALGRATRLIEDLLDVTRLETGGGISIVPRPQPLPALAREAFDMLEPAATAAAVALEARIAPDLPSVLADETRIVQVLGNLIGNALKYTPRGGLVRLSAAREGDELCVTVADTGKGMAAEHLVHMFDRFWQASPEDRRHGAGLGLAIVKGIVEAHGGRIWAESELGRGLTVTFTLPVASRAAESASMPP